jgi:YbbR domain-containing protein
VQLPGLSDVSRREALDLAGDAWRRGVSAVRGTPGLLLLSLFLGISLWVFVTEDENPTRVDDFPRAIEVEAVNVGTDLAVANPLDTVIVRISAPEDRWDDITIANFRAFVDLTDLGAREQEVRVQVDVENAGGGVRVVGTVPDVVVVNLEDLVRKEVPIRADVLGVLRTGYELLSLVPEFDTATVEGPETLVARVSAAQANVNLTGLNAGIQQSVTLVPVSSSGEIRGVRMEPAVISVTVDIAQKTFFRLVPFAAALTGQPAAGYRVANVSVSPGTLSVEGTIQAVQNLDSLALPPIDVSGERADVVRVVTVNLPNGVSTESSRAVTVAVTIEPIDSTTLITIAPTVEGLVTGREAAFESNVQLTLAGPLPLLNTLEDGDVQVILDLDGLGVGIYEVAVRVEVPEGVTVESMTPETVEVVIS